MISTTGGTSVGDKSTIAPEDEDDVHACIIHPGVNIGLDEFIEVLQLLLKESREPLRPQMNILRENGMRVTRACFAVIIKLAGLTSKLEGIL